MTKLNKPVVLYYPPKEIGTDEGSRCGKCMMFVKDHCTVVAGQIDGLKGVCGLYVHGKHSGPDMHGMMPKEIAGYIEDAPTHCGNCRYYGGGLQDKSDCAKVEGTVEFYGCCNHWEKKP